MPVRNTYVIVAVMIVSIACYLKADRMKHAGPVGDAISMIDRYYVDPVDHRALVDGAMQGVVSQLDPYSQFIDPSSYGHFQDALQQRFAGIGIIVEQPDKEDRVRVVTPLFATPAFKAGLRPGDRIMEVDGTTTEGLEIGKVSDLLRGPEGTVVSILVQRGDETLEVEVQRAWIPLESVLGDYRDSENNWVFRLREEPRIAYIRVTTFAEQTVEEVTAALEQLDNDFDSLIIDLRQNQGGLLSAAVDIADMFLEDEVIVTTRGRGGKLEAEFSATSGVLVDDDKPLVIMIDGDSASASEIVAASLKDHRRATVIGERTFGKGTVQNVLPLESGRSALKLTTARYYRPNGENIHRLEGSTDEDAWGVRPSDGFEVKMSDDQRMAAMKRLQSAAYPIMPGGTEVPVVKTATEEEAEQPAEAKADTPDAADTAESPDEAASAADTGKEPPADRHAIEQDPQLMRAVEFLKQTAAKSLKVAA
ncbi:S41 family peptidase [Rosistilla oblonga]|uniref:Carboxy-terminal processing protease CtpB n=1 Tax=Rosistilla oblonga TaxID=2527990 RepID=A0A518IUH7_9BACT|nr:S41 family peptidase [Rosistilla oblonga]QDV56745.1 Carboxy-terminal processing protease CtpB precursor [Rosistilla oblonga]